MNEIHGKNVIVEVFDGVAYIPFICCADCSINIRPEIIETTSVSTGRGITRKVRRIDWSLSLSGISTILGSGWIAFKTVTVANILAGYQIRMTFTDDNGNSAVFLGAVVLESASLSGPVEDFSAFENEMLGNGMYTLTVDDSGVPVTNDEVNSGWWLMAEGSNSITAAALVGKTVLEVDRSGMQYDEAAGAPGNREYRFDSTTGTIDFEYAAFEGGEKIFVLFK